MSIATPVAGETKLEKSVIRTFVAGTPGRPGYPGIPAVPAHYILVTRTAPPGFNLPAGWAYQVVYPPVGALNQSPQFVPTPPSGFANSAQPIVQAGATFSTRVLIPATPAVPGQTAIPATPAQAFISNNMGWNTSGRTVAELTGPGRFDFYAPLNLVGAVCGLCQFPTVDYAQLTHAMYLQHGQVQICESGSLLGVTYPYLDTDKLSIVVGADKRVHYQRNGLSFYRSTVICPFFVRLVSCLYVGLDAVYDIANALAYNEARSVLKPFYGFSFNTGTTPLGHPPNYGIGRMATMTTSSSNLPNHAAVGPYNGSRAGGGGALPPITSNSFSFPALGHLANFAVATLRAVGGRAAYLGYTARSTMVPLIGYSADRRYSFSNGSMRPITTYARSGGINPQYVVGESVLPVFTGLALSYLYQRATSSASMAPVIGISATSARYAYAMRPMKALIGRSFAYPVGYAFAPATALGTDTLSRVYHLITGTLNTALGSFTFVGRITLPQSMRSTALVSGGFTMRDKFLLSIASTVQAIAGTTSALKITLRLLAAFSSRATAADSLAMQKSMYVMMADRLRVSGMRSTVPNGADEFSPGGLTTRNGQTWVVNLDAQSTPSSRYEGYDFDSFAMIRGRYYGARADGIYELDGATDDGDEIKASVDFGEIDFGTAGLKRPTNAYIGVSSSGALVMKVETEGEQYLYVARDSNPDMRTQRFDFGKGLSGNYINFELFNGSGEDFDLERIEFMALPLSRRVRG